jgi:pantothenate kinase
MAVITDIAELLAHVARVRAGRDRVIIGLVGEPGSGKSTVAEAIVDRVGDATMTVPMDGFHLANRELRRLGREDRKGAFDTFDGHGYLNLIRRLRDQDEPVVYAPDYVRDVEEGIAGAIAITAEVPVIITEGNYLLAAEQPWSMLRDLLDEIWYLDTPRDVRLNRLIKRHTQFGKSDQQARAWALGPDEVNARFIRATRGHADQTIDVEGVGRSL